MFNAEQARKLALEAHASEVDTTLQHMENVIKESASNGMYTCIYQSQTRLSVTLICAISTKLAQEGYRVLTWTKDGTNCIQVEW